AAVPPVVPQPEPLGREQLGAQQVSRQILAARRNDHVARGDQPSRQRRQDPTPWPGSSIPRVAPRRDPPPQADPATASVRRGPPARPSHPASGRRRRRLAPAGTTGPDRPTRSSSPHALRPRRPATRAARSPPPPRGRAPRSPPPPLTRAAHHH